MLSDWAVLGLFDAHFIATYGDIIGPGCEYGGASTSTYSELQQKSAEVMGAAANHRAVRVLAGDAAARADRGVSAGRGGGRRCQRGAHGGVGLGVAW